MRAANPAFPGPGLRWALLAALAACGTALAVSRGPTPWAAPGAGGWEDPDVRRGAELDEQARGALRRVLEKERLTAEVAGGRLTLPEAAARFRDLDRRPPALDPGVFRHCWPGDTDEERYCRQVIGFVRERLARLPGGDAGVTERLRAELQRLLDRGELHLPDPDAAPAAP